MTTSLECEHLIENGFAEHAVHDIQGCFSLTENDTLDSFTPKQTNKTFGECLDDCRDKNYSYAGITLVGIPSFL